MSKLPMPVICECGFNTMDAKEAAEHLRKHKEPCVFCGSEDVEFHLYLWMCKRCERQVARGFEE